ncbi:MAG: beta-N-acetylhexosaminidase [Polyangiales bacterium]
MSELSIAASAGQVIVAGFPEQSPPDALCDLARAGQLGGFILFRWNLRTPVQVAELTLRLRSLFPAAAPPWIALDQEGGRVARLGPPVVRLPPMRVLGAIDQPALTRDAGRVLGEQLALLGFNLDFAPVLDVDTNPANPVIGDRSFGDRPERVIRHARAFAAGLADAGVASCGKHFPGHGDTHLDSHLALPRLSHDRERLDLIELAPFAALSAELPCMMSAHVLFDAVDHERPATLSRVIIHGLLREKLGFQGVIFSDDLEMKAVADTYGVPRAACLAIAAGCDQVLVCADPALTLQTHRALIAEAERDPAFAARLREAAQHGLAARERYPITRAVASARIERRLAAQEPRVLEARIQHAHTEVSSV